MNIKIIYLFQNYLINPFPSHIYMYMKELT
jgi:hypothetical protein